MFKKVLVAEDLDSINYAVAGVLAEMHIPLIDHAQHCDKAFLLAKRALQEESPYDLLICDLSFIPDYRVEKITSGKQLIATLKELDPNLKILVNSIEDQPQTVKELWDSGNIKAYVCKDRNGMKELKKAILEIADGRTYKSPKIEAALRQDNLFVLKKFDIHLLNCIANGLTQDEIQENFKQNNILPNSKSSIEKRLKELKEEFNANTNPHLIGIVKDLSLI